MVLLAFVNISPKIAYIATFGLITIETMGIPVPGEAALIASAILAHEGKVNIELLIVLAAAAAIIGDNVGFAIGRKYGRRVFTKEGPMYNQRLALLDMGEPFFAKHGPKAVFFGRWFAGLRIASAWLAGMNKMSWPTFVFWNALGGICWATGVGIGAYYAGHAFADVISKIGVYGAVAVAVGIVGFLYWRHRRHKAELDERGAQLRAQLEDRPVAHD